MEFETPENQNSYWEAVRFLFILRFSYFKGRIWIFLTSFERSFSEIQGEIEEVTNKGQLANML